MAEQHDCSMMENLYWWGIPTMFRCEHAGAEGVVPEFDENSLLELEKYKDDRANELAKEAEKAAALNAEAAR